jgi:hypothetical protein
MVIKAFNFLKKNMNMKYPKNYSQVICGFYLMFHNCTPYLKVNVIITYPSQYKNIDINLFIYIVDTYLP